ncbi:MAG: PAS domain S-box protein [Deltaproteobacteria bacterium]|nr:PAS domain S-box protein [Deltaproteobacteria bacterium]
MIFIVRLVVIITTAYFILFSPSASGEKTAYGYVFIALYLLTNLIVAYIPEKYFYEDKIFYGIILGDSILVPAGIYLSGYVGTDLYLIYFIIISLTTMGSSFGYLMLNIFVFSLIYGWLLYQQGLLTGPAAVSYAIRIPFIIVIAMFYGYLMTTRLKDKNRRIQEAQERYEQIIQATDVLMCIVDHEGKFLFANQKFLNFFGCSDERNILDLTISQIYNEDDQERDESLSHVKSVCENKNTVHYEHHDKNHDLWFSNILSPIIDPKSHEVISVCIISKDITGQIEKEKKLNDTVELLRRTRDQLIQKDKMTALGRMASGIAHEIRNPLEVINMGMDYLEDNLPDDNPQIRESIEKIFNAVNRAENIIKNVLSFARQSAYKITPISLAPLLDNVLTLAEQNIRNSGVSIRCDYDNEPLDVAGDFNMLEQVFLNLINNAVDAMKESEKKILTVRAYKQLVTEVGYKTGYRQADFFSIGDEMIVVEISDTGKGIPEETLPRVFEPFFTTKPLNEGTGLGLSIAYMIMERLFGTIDVESRENQGTAFFVKLQPKTKATDAQGGAT